MCKETLEVLEPDAQTAKRAAYEAFEFGLEAPGLVRVTNGSYGNEKDDHSYLVNVEDGAPVACECKSFQYRDGACKHMTAVAIREPVLEAVTDYESTQTPRAVADGGVVVGNHTAEENDNVCENGQEGCCGPDGDDLPCFDCYRT